MFRFWRTGVLKIKIAIDGAAFEFEGEAPNVTDVLKLVDVFLALVSPTDAELAAKIEELKAEAAKQQAAVAANS